MPQSRKPAGFSWPQFEHLGMAEDYDANAGAGRQPMRCQTQLGVLGRRMVTCLLRLRCDRFATDEFITAAVAEVSRRVARKRSKRSAVGSVRGYSGFRCVSCSQRGQ